MSMTSHPSENYTNNHKQFEAAHLGKAMTSLGSFFDDSGKRYEASFCASDHAGSFTSMDGQANAGMDYTKINDWFVAHRSHALTHCGTVSSDKGTADVWFCQVDKKFCFDDQS